jgi:hypothetical protein
MASEELNVIPEYHFSYGWSDRVQVMQGPMGPVPPFVQV